MTTTKRDELDGLSEEPTGAKPAPSASSLEETARIPPPPDDGQLVEWTGPLPAAARRKKQDRAAGPSEKHVYVPPVTLPPTKGPSALDQQKIMVAPSVLKPNDNSRNQPTIRRLPSVAAQAQPGAASDSAGQTLKTGAQPGPAQAKAAQGKGTSAQARAASAPGKASPWDKGGLPAVDREALPSAQLHATGSSRSAATPAKPEKPRSRGALVVAALLLGTAAASIYFLVAWPEPKPSPDTPIQVGAPTAPPTWEPAPLPAPPSTAVAPSTAAPIEAQPVAPPPSAATPVETSAAPPPPPPEPPPRPSVTARPPVTAKPPSTAKAPPTAEQPPPPPPPEPPPTSTTTAPPRPF